MATVEYEPTSQQVVAGTAPVLSVEVYSDGVLVDPGVTTVTITRLDGTAVVTGAATSGSGAAARTYALDAAETATLDILTVAWETTSYGTVEQTVEVVGDVLFTLRQARAHDSNVLSNSATYPAATIERARERITEDFERICGVSFVPRIRRVIVDGSGLPDLLLPDIRVTALRAVETLDTSDMTWDAYDAGDLAAVQVRSGGRLRRATGASFVSGRDNVRVTYEHGWTRVPEAIRLAALTVLRYTVVPDNVGQRATSMTNEFGSTAFATAGRVSNPWSAYPHYGIPMVDATLARYSERVPGVA